VLLSTKTPGKNRSGQTVEIFLPEGAFLFGSAASIIDASEAVVYHKNCKKRASILQFLQKRHRFAQ
jgi:hypothetical protein